MIDIFKYIKIMILDYCIRLYTQIYNIKFILYIYNLRYMYSSWLCSHSHICSYKDPFWCNVCISNQQTFQIGLSLQPMVLGNTYH
jgi:hypothetical protein